ncbi:NmrA family NAD(P)-binding protein [Bradyrhizobium sp. WYCCWR 13023]|uniref:NmrA family NAD(P)-binding protein n=1 Tax=Bradyrhizobium zhengyangense TaxID=2911009 RepID=A0A9X1R9Q5_9BRAD|nr:NmrA family NAD(P)-binding protein [Bradyrhizobium zhengyangense]MCG2626275.1 NmrA family NAD(P)-binding protein [Bradyrhizobium zhengyangense]MCG2644713.1 NmrA family NAD(P)-binding protein [Bradyrhizobium zhengyangense]MCG2668283.1 NmrA family NAD(P)-binding protein [Bradyrhizobium zhengyangense]
MSSHNTSKIFVVGGTGAQGMPIIRALVADRKNSARVLTRDPFSRRAKSLATLDNVSMLEGSFADEVTLREGFRGCDGAFINIDGFNTGEKTETYWAIRCYEIAIEEGIKFFVYGNLDYGLKKSGYDSRFRSGHYDGKGRIGDWILSQNTVNKGRMGAALFTSGPYIEMAFQPMMPMTPTVEDGIVTWRVPLGDGAVVHASSEDCGYYVRWLFDHPERTNGMNLEVAIEHVAYAGLAAAFTKVTGKPARYIDTDLHSYWNGPLKFIANAPAGYNADPNDKSTMTFRDNFTGFWNLWKYGIVKRDYALLDEIHPKRIKSAEEWMRREDKLGRELGKGGLWERVQPQNIQNETPILKSNEDRRKGRL